MKTEKAKSPAFQLYVQDFLVGTMHMNTVQIGAYILLLCYQWDKGKLPNDPIKLAAIGKVGIDVIEFIVEKFPRDPDGFLRNRRLEKEREKQKNFKKVKSEAGIEGNRKRWGPPADLKGPEISKDQQGAANFFYLGMEMFKIPVSQFINQHFQIFLNAWEPKNPTIKLQEVLNEMDKECVGKQFNDEDHIRNTFKLIAKNLNKPKHEKKSATTATEKSGINYGKKQ